MSKEVDEYGLSHNYTASVRLNCQHWIWHMNVGYLLHPDIPLKSTNLQVADVGTGTGNFLLDLSRSLPQSAQLHGYDLVTDQFPPKEWLPTNIKFSHLDILQPLPPDLECQYDVVHLRMMILVTQTPEAREILMRNLFKMLKPGGHLQWSDQDPSTVATKLATPDSPSAATDELINLMNNMNKARGAQYAFLSDMPALFKAHQLDVINFSTYPILPHLRSAQTDNQLTVFLEMSFRVINKGPDGESRAANYRKLLGRVAQEAKSGTAITMDMMVCVGQKQRAD